MENNKGYLLKVILDSDNFELMNKAITHLSDGEFFYINNSNFCKWAIRFYSDLVCSSEEIGIAFKKASSNSSWTHLKGNKRKNIAIPINLSKLQIDCIHKGIKTLDASGLTKITMANYCRLSVIYFSKYVLDKQLGLAFRPPKK